MPGVGHGQVLGMSGFSQVPESTSPSSSRALVVLSLRLWEAPSVATARTIGGKQRSQLSKVEQTSELVPGALRPL